MNSIYFFALLLYILNFSTAQDKSLFSYSDIYDPAFRPRSFNPIWIKDSNDFLFRNGSGNLYRFNVDTKSSTIFIQDNVFNTYGTVYSLSPDLKYVLFASNVSMRYRRSYRAKYVIYSVENTNAAALANNDTLEYAGWGPVDNALSYIDSENNLYYQESATASSAMPLTDTGSSTLFNGIPDWLYEEDVIESRVSHYWSPDGRYICFSAIDDTGVPFQDVPYYGDVSDVYGKTIKIPYPKAGDISGSSLGRNPRVRMLAVDVTAQSPTPVELLPPSQFPNENERYFISVYWKSNSNVMVTWANRVQNHSISHIYDVNSTSSNTGIKNLEYTTNKGWIEMSDTERVFIENGDRYLMIFPKGSFPDTFRVPHVVSSDTNAVKTELFANNFETDRILAYDKKGIVYFITTYGDPSERHIARVGVPSTASENVPLTCLTCNNGIGCRYLSATFNEDASYYVEGCLGPDVPVYTLKSTIDSNYKVVMENNAQLNASANTKLLPTKEYFTFKTAGGNYDAKGEVFIPPNPQQGERFKMLVYTYAGPGTQLVLKTYLLGSTTANWLVYLGSTHRIAVLSLDGRGASGSGDKLKFEMYKNMGSVEIQDQIAGAKAALQLFDWLDADSNFAMFGWSYGGFTTAHAVADSSNFFTCGISVAPVTDQAFYDTAYAERYLGLDIPEDGKNAYEASSLMNKVGGFNNKIFLIAHGMADDNVHYMNTAHLIRSLEDADVLFEQITYPDDAHSISTPSRNKHLYHSMSFFLNSQCWNKNSSRSVHASALIGFIVILLAKLIA